MKSQVRKNKSDLDYTEESDEAKQSDLDYSDESLPGSIMHICTNCNCDHFLRFLAAPREYGVDVSHQVPCCTGSAEFFFGHG